MPFNASGLYQRLFNWRTDRDTGTKILAGRVDQETDGIVSALNDLIQGNVILKGPLKNVSGTAANPAYTFGSDQTSGLFLKGDGSIGVSVSGVEIGAFPASFFTGISGHLANTANPHGVTAAQLGLEIGSDIQGFSAVLDATSASFTTSDETKLDNIESGADVTDATNVQSAGALMDSELSSIAAVKALDQGVATTDSPTFADLVHIENSSGNAGLRVISGTSGVSYINLGDTADNNDGSIEYDNSTREMLFKAADSVVARLTSGGHLAVGTTDDSPNFGAETTSGIVLKGDGLITASKSAGDVLALQRTSSDGAVITVFKDTSSVGTVGASSGHLYVGGLDTALRYDNGGNNIAPFNPSTLSYRDNAVDLGSASARFDDIYATNSSIQTSDETEKQAVCSLTELEQKAALALSRSFCSFKWNDSVNSKGEKARVHIGQIAQNVEAIMSSVGLDASKYAFFTKTTWWEYSEKIPEVAEIKAQDAVIGDDGEQVSEAIKYSPPRSEYTRVTVYETELDAPDGAERKQRLGLRYTELLSFICSGIAGRADDVEKRLIALEAGN